MHPLLQALFSAWEWRLDILIVLTIFGALYIVGWRRLRRQSQQRKLATKLRLAAYMGGLAALAISLMSPIDRLSGQLFFVHMIQHLLSIMLAAPLLWLGNPFPFLLWGIPHSARPQIAALFRRDAGFRRALRFITQPGVAWLAFITVYLGWHDPGLYNLALRREWVHDLQHITFFVAAMLYWWRVVDAGPRLHGRFPAWARLIYVIGAIPPNMLAGVMIAFAAEPIYAYYAAAPRIWGLSVVEDQMLAGVIMWIPGSMMYIVAALILAAGLLQGEDGCAPRHRPDWDSEEAMAAPGFEQRVLQNKWRRLDVAKAHASDAT